MEAPAVEVVDADTIRSITRGESDSQVDTAKRFPRDIRQSQRRCMDMATLDEQTAEACLFALPTADGAVEGPSVRLAEIVAANWGNLRAQCRIVDEGAKFVTAQAAVWDVETNVAISIETKRRIVGKSGKRYPTNVIQSTMNAARSIAFRDAVFKAVPRAVWQPVYEACKQKVVGEASTLVKKRKECVAQFAKMGVFEDALLSVIECGSLDEMTPDDLAKLRSIFRTIRDGEATVDEMFPTVSAPAPAEDSTPLEKAQAAATKARETASQDGAAAPDTPAPTSTVDNPGAVPGKLKPAKKISDATYQKIHAAAMSLPSEKRVPILNNFGLNIITRAKGLDPETANDLLIELEQEVIANTSTTGQEAPAT